jgi:hypothetical protein
MAVYYTNDNWSYYDLNTHRYVLKPEYIRDNYGIELISALDTTGAINAVSVVNNFLKRASRVLYSYIFNQHSGQVEYMRYRLVKHPEYRHILLEAMGELVYSWLINNNDLSIQNGISIDTGKLYERLDAAQNQVPIVVQEILYNEGITWRARWTFDKEYEDDKIYKGIDW